MSAACADIVQHAAISTSARKTRLPITQLHHATHRDLPLAGAGLVTEVHFFRVRFIESFKLKAC
jgi:hypothetical protein